MAFILKKQSEGYFYPVELAVVTEQGTRKTHKIEWRFKRHTREDLNALRAENENMSSDGDTLENDLDYIMKISDGAWKYVTDEDGRPVEFTRDNVRAVLNDIPSAAGAVVSAFFASALGAPRKNS